MAEKSLFFNALPSEQYETGYDRNYNADDISDWLSVVWDTGVVKGGLAVEAGTNLDITLGIGRAAINGKAYINDAIKTFTIAPNGGNETRYDYLIVRFNNTVGVRAITAELITGTNNLPTTADSLTRSDNIYDIMLAYIAVAPAATVITQANITDTRGYDDSLTPAGTYVYGDLANACPYFTAVKGYDNYYDAIIQHYESIITLPNSSALVITTLPANLYNDKYSIVEVYTNGIKETDSNYTVGTTGGYVTITFTASKDAGAVITVDLGNFIDGDGLSTAIAGYTAFTEAVTKLETANEYVYICNGSTDNIAINDLVNSIVAGGVDYGTYKINIVGNFGYTAFNGNGTLASPYTLFSFNSGNRNIVIDFANCSEIEVNAAGVYVTVFNTDKITVNNASIKCTGTGTNAVIKIFDSTTGVINCSNCHFSIISYKDSLIAYTGTFNNCYGTVLNSLNNSYCFNNYGLLRLNGGEYLAYCGSTYESAVVGQSQTNAVSILQGVNAATIANTGYTQTYSIKQYSGGGYVNCYDLITTLTASIVTGAVVNTIPLNKPNAM